MCTAGDGIDRLTSGWSRALPERFTEFAVIPDNSAVLEVSAGTGAIAAAVTARCVVGSFVGVDPLPEHVAIANARQIGAGVRFETGDPRQLCFLDDTFDVALSFLALPSMSHTVSVIEEMVRVTRPDGTIAVAIWEFGGGNEMLRVFWDQVSALNPLAAAGDRETTRLCSADELRDLFQGVGLCDVRDLPLTIATPFESFDDYWLSFLDGHDPARTCFARLASTERDELRSQVRTRLLGRAHDGPLQLQARAWAVRAVVPRPMRQPISRPRP